jgi:hypothetical protein
MRKEFHVAPHIMIGADLSLRSRRQHKALSLPTFLPEEMRAFFVATRPKKNVGNDKSIKPGA